MVDRPARTRTRRLLAAAVGLLVALAVAEGVLRLTHAGVYERRVAAYHFLWNEDGGWWYFNAAEPPEHAWDGDPYGRLPPGAKMTYPINAVGLRGPVPASGRPTVLMVGDSFTFGEGVQWDDTFVARIERGLASRGAPALVDAGIPGYGTVEEAARFPLWLAQFHPKAAVLVFIPNDAVPLSETMDKDDLLQPAIDQPPLYLMRLISGALGGRARNRAVEDWYLSYYFGERRSCWDDAKKALADMQARAAQSGSRFGVVIFPLLHRLDDYPFAPIHAAVAEFCRGRGIAVLDLAPVFAHETDRDLWIHPIDHHPDARAHAVAAEAMTPFVESLLR